jgi:hypothetical protein
MADNQIRLDIGPGLKRLEHSFAVPDLVLELSAAVVRPLGRPALRLVLNPFHAIRRFAGSLGNERAAKPVMPRQMRGNVPKLGRVILMDKQEMHAARVRALVGNEPFIVPRE